jgi:two-component system, NarL family, response regulator NreC
MNSEQLIRIQLAGGRKIMREGLCLLLERHGDFKVVGESDELHATAKLARAISPNVVLLSASTLTSEVTQAIISIRESTEAQAIVLCVHPEPSFVQEIVKAGAKGCLARDSASGELVAAIRTVSQGKMYVSPNVAAVLVTGGSRTRAEIGKSSLTPREREVLARLAEGQSARQIAKSLQISVKTVETHRRRIMDKLHKRTLPELTKYAILEGLTSLEISA